MKRVILILAGIIMAFAIAYAVAKGPATQAATMTQVVLEWNCGTCLAHNTFSWKGQARRVTVRCPHCNTGYMLEIF